MRAPHLRDCDAARSFSYRPLKDKAILPAAPDHHNLRNVDKNFFKKISTQRLTVLTKRTITYLQARRGSREGILGKDVGATPGGSKKPVSPVEIKIKFTRRLYYVVSKCIQ